MRDLRLGKREQNRYYLLDGKGMSPHEWKKLVKTQAEEKGERAILRGLLEVAKRSQQGTYAEEMALLWYVHRYHEKEDWVQMNNYKPVEEGDLKAVKVDGEYQMSFV